MWLLENKALPAGRQACLGPITQGGCGAICVSGGSPCYGCFGIRDEANIPALRKILEKFADEKEIERYFSMFHSRSSQLIADSSQTNKLKK